jgi:hypothetical protein
VSRLHHDRQTRLLHRCRCLAGIFAADAVMTACREREPAPALRAVAESSCEGPGATHVVERLGERMKHVSLQAADSVIVRQIREAYAPLVTPDLLETWIGNPAHAPGRQVSSPWPDRIEVRSVKAGRDNSCLVEGEVVYLTSVELTEGGTAARESVTLQVVADSAWRVSAYSPGAGGPGSAERVEP